jgi:hypothetical protein
MITPSKARVVQQTMDGLNAGEPSSLNANQLSEDVLMQDAGDQAKEGIDKKSSEKDAKKVEA